MRIFSNRENRSYSPGLHSQEELFSAFPSHIVTGANMSWNEYNALRNSDIFTALMCLSTDIAKLDIKVKEKGIIKDKDRLENLLNNKPNKLYNGFIFKKIVMLAALLTKHGYVLIERNPSGVPIELFHIPTSRVQLKEYRDKEGYYYEVSNGDSGSMIVDFGDILDFKPYSTNGFDGVSALDSLKDDLDAQTYSKRFFANFFRSGANVGGMLKLHEGRLNREQRDKIRKQFQEDNAGTANSSSVMILDEAMSYQKLEVSTDLLQIIMNNKQSPMAISKAFGLPPSKLGIESPNTSMQDQMNEYLYNTLSSYTKMMTAELNFKLINSKDDYTKEFIFDTTSYRQVNYKEYVETLNTQLQNGGITLDEYRSALGMPNVPDGLGSTHRVDLNHVDLTIADNFQMRDKSVNNQSVENVDKEDTSDKGGVIDE